MRSRCLAVFVSLLAGLVLAPLTALAGDYSMTGVHLDVAVQPDGTIEVSERRAFEFDDDVNGIYWTIPEGENQQGGTSSVQVMGMSEDGGSGTKAYTESAYAVNGDAGIYTVDEAGGAVTLKVYSPHVDGDTATYTLTYRMAGAVMAWPDTAELYWKFVGSQWAEDSQDVTVDVTFAGASASGVAAATGENFRAWAHGPLDGTVSLDAGDTAAPTVSYAVPRVSSGEFAEGRIVFPTAWVPQLTVSGPDRLDTVLTEERAWAEDANRRREEARAVATVLTVASLAAPALLLAGVAAVRLMRGGAPKPTFDETYLRDVPSDDHPAVIAAFMGNGAVDNRALVATLMKLADERRARVHEDEREVSGLFGRRKTESTFVLEVEDGALAAMTEGIDRAALEVYLGRGRTKVAFDEMREMAEGEPRAFSKRWERFTEVVKGELDARGLIASTGRAAKAATVTLAAICFVLDLGVGIYTEAWWIPVAGLVLCALACLVGATFKRYTPEGAELAARCAALKRWLEDFTRLDEAVPGDVVLWNKLLVFAVALGVSEKVLQELAAATPRSYDDYYTDPYLYPSWWWFSHRHGHETLFSSASSAGELSIAALSASSNSSVGGLGGGFSSGGGGGVGGGGGGTF